MSVMRSPWRFAAATLVGAAVVVGAVGCAASGSRSTSSGASAVKPAEGGGTDKAAGQAQGLTPGQVPGKPGDPAATETRSLIFTGTVTVRVANVERAAAEVSALATAAGGFVGGDDRTSDQDRSQARMTLRIPSARFTGVVDGLGKLNGAKEESRQLSTQDVTDQVADVDARIATGQASVNRVRDLLARAQTIGEIVSLESELSRREADLESLKTRKRKLDDLTTLSTVTAVLLGPRAATEAPSTGFLAGLSAGWHSFVASLRIALTVFGALLPWLVLLALPALVVWWTLRRARRSRPAVDPVPSATE